MTDNTHAATDHTATDTTALIHQSAADLVELCQSSDLMIATAESCTGGMIASSITDIAGSSAVFDRGFVTYSNESKAEMLGVPIAHTVDPGAVSAVVATEMVAGALRNSNADIAVAVTGIAGPGGGSDEKPVGLVFIASQRRGAVSQVEEFRFCDAHGDLSRAKIRELTVIEAHKCLQTCANRPAQK